MYFTSVTVKPKKVQLPKNKFATGIFEAKKKYLIFLPWKSPLLIQTVDIGSNRPIDNDHGIKEKGN